MYNQPYNNQNNNQIRYVPVNSMGQPIPQTPPQRPEPVVQQKEIQIAQIGQPRVVGYTDRRTGQQKQFTVYEFWGNDGIKYEASNQEWMSLRRVGEVVKIKFEIVSTTGRNGQVYTNYRIVVPSLNDRIQNIETRLNNLENRLSNSNVPPVSAPRPVRTDYPSAPTETPGPVYSPVPVSPTNPPETNEPGEDGYNVEEEYPENEVDSDVAPRKMPF